MKTTYTADKNAFIIDGEVYLTGYGPSNSGSYYYNTDLKTCQQYRCEYGENKMVIYTTNKNLTTVKLLPREVFVKPQVDVEELADKAGWEYSTFDQAASAFSLGFEAGHYANKNQFTKEEMEQAFRSGWSNSENINSSFELEDSFEWFLKSIRPLSLPQEITIENHNVTVKW